MIGHQVEGAYVLGKGAPRWSDLVAGASSRVAAADIHSKTSPASPASLNEVQDQLKTPTYL